MRLHFGPIPESSEFQPQATGWRPLQEPRPGMFVLLASGVGLIAGAIMGALWMTTAHEAKPIGLSITTDSVEVALLYLLGTLVGGGLLLVVVHELLHAAAFPGGWRSERTILGAWPRMGVFYAHYDGPQSRNRALVVFLMPFLVLTLGLWLVDLAFPSGWSGLLAACSVVNAAFAGGDLLAAAMIGWQLPANAQMRNQGWQTWWRVPTIDAGGPAQAAASLPAEAMHEP